MSAESSTPARDIAAEFAGWIGKSMTVEDEVTLPAVRRMAAMLDLDPMAFFGDWEGELQRCAAQHWWARGMDQTGAPMAVILRWDATREALADRRLSPLKTAATTRSRKSSERGRTIRCWPPFQPTS